MTIFGSLLETMSSATSRQLQITLMCRYWGIYLRRNLSRFTVWKKSDSGAFFHVVHVVRHFDPWDQCRRVTLSGAGFTHCPTSWWAFLFDYCITYFLLTAPLLGLGWIRKTLPLLLSVSIPFLPLDKAVVFLRGICHRTQVGRVDERAGDNAFGAS